MTFRIDRCVDSDSKRGLFSHEEVIKFTIHDFEDRIKWESVKYNPVKSSILKAHGYEWQIGARCVCDEYDHFVSIALYQLGKNISTKCSTSVKGSSHYFNKTSILYKEIDTRGRRLLYIREHEILKDYLQDDGSLVIEIGIGILHEDNRVWYPKGIEINDALVELYENASETSDVRFAIGDKVYMAHKNILALKCKKLHDISQEFDDDDGPIIIPSMRWEVFQALLEFVYTVKPPSIESEETAIEFLVAADRCDCVQLKLYVESVIVDKLLKSENAAAFFVLADSHSCALLKEAASWFFRNDSGAIKKSEAWSQIQESPVLVKELLDVLMSPKSGDDGSGEVDNLSVASLRRKLDEAKLELDGSREMLVKRLKLHAEGQSAAQDGSTDEN